MILRRLRLSRCTNPAITLFAPRIPHPARDPEPGRALGNASCLEVRRPSPRHSLAFFSSPKPIAVVLSALAASRLGRHAPQCDPHDQYFQVIPEASSHLLKPPPVLALWPQTLTVAGHLPQRLQHFRQVLPVIAGQSSLQVSHLTPGQAGPAANESHRAAIPQPSAVPRLPAPRSSFVQNLNQGPTTYS